MILMILKYVIAVFIMSLAVGILYRIPRSSLFAASMTGTAAFLVQLTASQSGLNVIVADFLGSITAAIIAEYLARVKKKPATIYLIPGFIPLVPGREAYLTMTYMVQGEYVLGVAMGMQTVLTAGAIAFGIFVSSTIFRFVINYRAGSYTKYAGKS